MTKAHRTTTAPTSQIAPFGLRMLPALREQIEAAAKSSGRSMNAEIVARLEASFPPEPEQKFNVEMEIGGPIVRENKDGTFTQLTVQEFARLLAKEIKKN